MALTKTISAGGSSCLFVDDAFNTTNTNNVSSSFLVNDYENVAIQMIFASITGAQPAIKIQQTNDETNWDDISGATHTTTSAAESKTIIIAPATAKYMRVKTTTASTTGTCTCYVECNGRK